MDQLFELTGRRYGLFEYQGHPLANRLIIIMGSAVETVQETVKYLIERGEKVAVLKYAYFDPLTQSTSLPRSHIP